MEMRRRRKTTTCLLGLATTMYTAYAASIYSLPMEIRKQNYVRVSEDVKCEECMTMERFYHDNPLGFVLFYARELRGVQEYKAAIVRGWTEVCQELRWSRIACGMVDMVSDKPYAERYIDPKTAPAHIVVRNSEPVLALKEQVAELLAKPGDKATMLAHVADLLKGEGTIGHLRISAQVNGREALQQTFRRHQVVIAAFIGEEKLIGDHFRSAVQELVVGGGMVTRVNRTEVADTGRKGKGKAEGEKEKWRIAFVAAYGKGVSEHFGAAEGTIGAFLDGVLQPGAVKMARILRPDAKSGDKESTKAMLEYDTTLQELRKLVDETGQRAAGQEKQAKSTDSQDVKSGAEKKEKRRKKKSKGDEL